MIRGLLFACAFAALFTSGFAANATSVWNLEPNRLPEADARGWEGGDLKLVQCTESEQLTGCKYSLFGVATVYAFADSEKSLTKAISLKCKPQVCDGKTLDTFSVYLLRSVSSLEDEVLSAWVLSAFSAKIFSTADLNIIAYRDDDGFAFIIQKSE